jgi:hypothetical protein
MVWPGLLIPFGLLSAEPNRELTEFLLRHGSAKPADLAALSSGKAYAAALPGSVNREIITVGAVRVMAPAERTVTVLRDIPRLESGKAFRHTRLLSRPPVLEDFAALQLSPEDVTELKKCRPGACSFNLTKEDLALVARMNWDGPDVVSKLNQLARRAALDYVNAYRRGGNRELAIYVDKERPTFVADEFEEMVRRMRLLPTHLPDLTAVLLTPPAGPYPRGFEDLYYWSEAVFGLKPVVRINHVVLQSFPAESSVRYAVATKQLYANHYFHTALEIRVLVQDEAIPGRAHYLLVLNMARSDGLTGMFGGLVKAKAQSSALSGLKLALEAIKRRVETPQ